MEQNIFKDDITQEEKKKAIEMFCVFNSTQAMLKSYNTLDKIFEGKDLIFLSEDKDIFYLNKEQEFENKTRIALAHFLKFTLNKVKSNVNIIESFEIDKEFCSSTYVTCSIFHFHNPYLRNLDDLIIKAGYKPTENDKKTINDYLKFKYSKPCFKMRTLQVDLKQNKDGKDNL